MLEELLTEKLKNNKKDLEIKTLVIFNNCTKLLGLSRC
jgi:hypothetical protein